jgi:hypothetical protein
MAYGLTFTYGGQTIHASDMVPTKVPSTTKQKIGTRVVEIPVLGKSTQDYMLNITGIIIASSLTELGTLRAALEALDDGEPHAYVDGIHDGNYIIQTRSLKFQDTGQRGNMSYVYTMVLIQKQ